LKALIVGGSGLIGSYFVRHWAHRFQSAWLTYQSHPLSLAGAKSFELDITKREKVFELLDSLKPRIVIHAAALTQMDLCETNRALADKINIEGTNNILQACDKIKSRLVFLSTSAVFSESSLPVLEEAEPRPINYYGQTKLASERSILSSLPQSLIVRLDHPYGWNYSWQKKNSVSRILEECKMGRKWREVENWWNQPTYSADFVEIVTELIDKGCFGIYHVASPDFITRFDLALQVAKVFNISREQLVPFSASELKLFASRAKVNLSVQKVTKELGRSPLSVSEGLLRMKNESLPN